MTHTPPRIVAIGEVMVELAPVQSDVYQRGFAGDTFNTAWHIRQLLAEKAQVGYVTHLGQDALSDQLIAEMRADGLDTSGVKRDADRTMGLYVIALQNAERSFHYWRGQAAARRLADDPMWLAKSLKDASLVHLSGITVAILDAAGRDRLLAALVQARRDGAKVSFDPNIRPGLWTSSDEIRQTIPRFLDVTDIALPSFDDEAAHFGDATPAATIMRLATSGIREIVVKNGAGAVTARINAQELEVKTPSVTSVIDTSGAGDAFNAGYLAARLLGRDPEVSIAEGQAIAGQVIGCRGARIPKRQMAAL